MSQATMTGVFAALALLAVIVAVVLDRTRRRQLKLLEQVSLRVRVSHALAEGLVAGNPITDVLRILLPERADWCVLHLVDGDRVRRAAVVHVDPDREQQMREAFARVPFAVDAKKGPANVIRTGQSELDTEVTSATLELQPDPAVFRAAGLSSVMSVPLRVGQEILGALTLARRVPHAYGDEDLSWAEDVAHRIGLALENRRLYAEARELFEQSVSANFVSAPDGTILACNHMFASLLGFDSPQDALATHVSSLYMDPLARDEFLARLQAQKHLVGYELSLRRRDGRPVSVIAEAVAQCDDSGRVTKIRGFLLDRTAQEELEARLRQAQRLEVVGQLAGGVAHDFNNLIGLIVACADMLKTGGIQPDGPGPTPLDELTQAARRAASLTQQLLAFSRRQVLQPRVLGLNDALRKMHGTLRRHVPPRIVLMLELAPHLERVQADPDQLERTIVNLVENAVDAMSTAGTLTVSTRPMDTGGQDAAGYSSMRPGRYVVLSIEDTGLGMDAATSARVFEPFFTTKPAGTGAGLGLSTAYGIVRQSGGYVRIKSTPAVGTTVTVYLPLVPDQL